MCSLIKLRKYDSLLVLLKCLKAKIVSKSNPDDKTGRHDHILSVTRNRGVKG